MICIVSQRHIWNGSTEDFNEDWTTLPSRKKKFSFPISVVWINIVAASQCIWIPLTPNRFIYRVCCAYRRRWKLKQMRRLPLEVVCKKEKDRKYAASSSPTSTQIHIYQQGLRAKSSVLFFPKWKALCSSVFSIWSSNGGFSLASFSARIMQWLWKNPTSQFWDETTIMEGFVFITVILYVLSWDMVTRYSYFGNTDAWELRRMELTGG